MWYNYINFYLRRVIFTDGNAKKIKINAGTVLRWTVYLICLIIIGSLIFRQASTATPGELKNHIIKSASVQRAHIETGGDLAIYQINVRNAFAIGDALYIDSVYYIEDAENLHITLRCKNNRIDRSTLGYWLKVSYIDENENEDEDLSNEVYADIAGYFPKDTKRYNYLVMSFDDVKIDYRNSKVELFVFRNTDGVLTEEDAIARFTIFDINMPKSKIQAKKFDLD